MALAKLAQIQGGLQLRQDVNALMSSYAATKVLTTVVKTAAVGEEGAAGYQPAVYYNADELLNGLSTKVAGILGGGSGLSLDSLSTAITGLENKAIKDVVKLELQSTASGTVTAPTAEQTAGLDTEAAGANISLPVYTLDNRIVYDTTGAQLRYNLATNALSGTPADAKTDNGTGTVTYPAKTATFNFKVFPQGAWTLKTLPAEALLDNNEMQAAAYDQAINQLAEDLSKNSGIISAVQSLVGQTAIQTQITNITAGLTTRIEALEAVRIVDDKITVTGTSATSEWTLSYAPTADLVQMNVNGFVYTEGDEFSVTRNTKKANWTSSDFDINENLAGYVRFHYRTTEPVANNG